MPEEKQSQKKKDTKQKEQPKEERRRKKEKRSRKDKSESQESSRESHKFKGKPAKQAIASNMNVPTREICKRVADTAEPPEPPPSKSRIALVPK